MLGQEAPLEEGAGAWPPQGVLCISYQLGHRMQASGILLCTLRYTTCLLCVHTASLGGLPAVSPQQLTEQLHMEGDNVDGWHFYHFGLEEGVWLWTVSLRYGSAPRLVCLW